MVINYRKMGFNYFNGIIGLNLVTKNLVTRIYYYSIDLSLRREYGVRKLLLRETKKIDEELISWFSGILTTVNLFIFLILSGTIFWLFH